MIFLPFDFASSLDDFSYDPHFRKYSISDFADDFQASFSLPFIASCIDAGVSGSDIINVLNTNSCMLLICVDVLGRLTLFCGVEKLGFNVIYNSRSISE